MATLQEQYNLITEGKGVKDVFLKHAKKLFPNMIPNHYGFEDSVNILKQRSVITENIWGIATESNKQPDWFKIFNENINEPSEEEIVIMSPSDNKANPKDGFSAGFFEEGEDEYNNYCQDCETIYQWIRLNGGGDLLDSHNIKSGIWLKKAMESGKITPSEIDKVTNKSASGLSFSELPLVKKMMDKNKALNEAKEANPKETKVKATSTKVAKEVEDIESHAYDNKETKKTDNVIFDQLIRGVQFEMHNPKNTDKTVEEIKNIVLKNLTKDPIWYTKNAMFGLENVGYTEETPGLGKPKESKGKYKSSGMEPVNNDKVKSNVKDGGSEENKKGMPKKVDQMTMTPKSSKGVQKMALPGKPKTIKPKN